MSKPDLPDPSWVLAIEILLLAAALALLLVPDWPRGFVAVQTIPSASTIIPDGGLGLRSPAWIPVPAGGIAISVTREGYASVDTLISPGMRTMIVYLDYVFPVTVTSRPSGASILLDGEEAGTTPVTLQVTEPGRHLIEAVAATGLVLREQIVLAANSPSSVHFSFPSLAEGGLVFIPGGEYEFQAGPGGTLPPRTVRVEDFFLGRTEVTNGEFNIFLNSVDPLAVPDPVLGNGRTEFISSLFVCDYPLEISAIESGGYSVLPGRDGFPVRGVTYAACSLYCDWLTLVDDSRRVFRLPDEIEWEYAASTGDGREWPWGDIGADGSMLNCSDACEMIAARAPWMNDGFPETSPAGYFPGNPWGLRDMAGNVWEWCSNRQGSEGLTGSAPSDTVRCLRGGSWLSAPEDCRVAARMCLDSGMGYPFAGFRVAATETRP